MEKVLFERVERIKRALPDELVPGLVAVFSKAHTDDLLWCYLSPPDGGRRPPRSTAMTLTELPDVNLLDYDGPTLGLAAVDLIRPDIPTKGHRFVRLDRILRRRNQVHVLRQTWADLAERLTQMVADGSLPLTGDDDLHRVRAEIAGIAAPQKIAALPIERRRGMVAFIPDRNQALCLGEVDLDTIGSVTVGPEEKVVALEEVRPLIEAGQPARWQNHYPIELRTILHRGQLEVEAGEALLTDTLGRLSREFHHRWRTTGAVDDCERAYGLAVELQLGQGDVDDLVAVVPEADFESFLATGAGTYVYRRPLEGGPHRYAGGVRRRHLDDARPALVGPDSPAVFTLLPLSRLAGSGSTKGCYRFDLGPPLRKGGRTEILARNAWLLAQDLLDAPREQRIRSVIPVTVLCETLEHCCAIFSLTDPWRTRQGRRNEWLQECYRLLDRALGTAGRVETASAPYYKALALWYGCAVAPDGASVLTLLELMMATLTGKPSEPHRDESDPETRARAELLRSVGTALLDLLRGGGRAEAYQELFQPEDESVPLVVRRATDMVRPLELLSPPFRQGFRRYAGIADSIRRTRSAHIPVRDKIEGLLAGKAQLRTDQRLIFAPLHQAHILDALYTKAIDDIDEFVDRLKGGALLEVELGTHAIAAGQDDTGIVLAVTNVGSMAATDVEVALTASDAFHLLGQSFQQTLAQLAPEGEHRFRFSLQPLTNDDTLPIRCEVSYADTTRDRQRQTLEFILRVTGLDTGPFRPKPNPYVFGLPLQEPHQFYGRRDELEQLLDHLAVRRPQNILLRGARRTGKTSLLNMVQAVLTDVDGRAGARSWFELPPTWHEALDATVPVLLDLQAIDWPQSGPTPTGLYHAVLAGLREAGLTSPTGELLLDDPVVSATQFRKALGDIMDDAGDRRPVILVDEFDVLDRIADKSFYGPLRSTISAIQGVTWIVASALGLYKEVRDYESPLFNIFKIIPLGVLEPEAARRVVRRPWQSGSDRPGWSPLQFADDAVESILEEAGHYPYFIQLLCSEIVDYANRTETGFVQYKTVLQVIDRRILTAGSAASEHFAYLWERAGGLGKVILLALLHHPVAMDHAELRAAVLRRLQTVAPHHVTRALSTFEDNLQRLVMMDAIRRVPGSGFAFGIPLFRRVLLKRDERENLDQAAIEELARESPPEVRRA